MLTIIEFFPTKVWGWTDSPHLRKNSCHSICTLWRRFASRLATPSEIKFQPILFVDSSEIRLWKSMWNFEMIHESLLFSINFYKKFKNDVFVSQFYKDFWTQIRFNKWFSLNASCSFLTTSWNFLLLHVRWLNNSQSCLLPPFYLFIHFFVGKFCCYHIMERIHQPKCFCATC